MGHWKPKVFTENTDFYIHLKERQKIVRLLPGKYYQLEGATVIRFTIHVQQHIHSYEVCCVTGCPADPEQPNSYPVPSWAF